MSKLISLDKERKMRYNRHIIEMAREIDASIQLAYKIGLCPDCGLIFGDHTEDCKERKNV